MAASVAALIRGQDVIDDAQALLRAVAAEQLDVNQFAFDTVVKVLADVEFVQGVQPRAAGSSASPRTSRTTTTCTRRSAWPGAGRPPCGHSDAGGGTWLSHRPGCRCRSEPSRSRFQRRVRADLVAFFGCLYFAAMRPAEAVHLRAGDCVLPDTGWGRVELDGSAPRAGSAWTDHGAPFDPRQLKHRARKQPRTVPIPPELVTLLRRHLEHYGAADDGRLFPARNGGYLSESVYGRIWHKARATALTPAQDASPLAVRPYDLRHGGVSLWLNAGVPATDVAERAGHSVAVLLKVYATCIHGQTDTHNQRIADALPPGDSSPDAN